MAFPRSPDRGPIEAGVVGGWPEGQPLDFRDHQIAAPLKHCALTLKRKMDVIFPRSPDRGPIEASKALAARSTVASHFRDHQIAAPLKHCPFAPGAGAAPPHFRDHQIAAPLKLDDSLERSRWCLDFRDHQIAAPLKPGGKPYEVTPREGEFPRSPDRGPIEAICLLPLETALRLFPRSPDRGPIEADAVREFP